ncbi:hypothetical protein [Clostridium sp. HBUAS56010]|uniref:hypothetical protein n=1 Tax=Clostridium sp. HBUAS56010 TaxID=2571127 RepID=UPI00117783F0|nr:hypothetical protein [Clostridium sp. HBUAS56010]
MAYEEYPHSQFPGAIDNFDNMQDISASLVDAMVSYQTAISNKDFTAAAEVISNNPDLLKVLINADRINSIQDAIKAVEKYYLENVEDMITTISQNTIGINDTATGNDKKTNAYSAEKTEFLSGIVIASNIKIPVSAWGSNLTYVYSNSSILANDRVEVDFASASIIIASKALIYIQDDSGAGNITFKVNKLPKAELTIKEIRLVRN